MSWTVGAVLLLAAGEIAPAAETPREVTPESEAASRRAVQFLVSAQNNNGSWGIEPGTPGDPGTTSTALLSLLAAGNTPQSGPQARVVRRGLGWTIDRAQRMRRGEIQPDDTTLLQRKLGHHIHSYFTAILFAEIAGMVDDADDQDSLDDKLGELAEYIVRAQQPDGSWGQSYESSLTMATAWIALRSAHAAGRDVETASPERAVEYVLSQYDAETGGFRDPYRGGEVRYMSTAASLRVLYGWGQGDREEVQRATDALFRMQFDAEVQGSVGGEEYLGALFGTQALYHRQDEEWYAWFAHTRDRLISIQNSDGSWTGHHCVTSRVFCTACALWTLQVPKRLLVLLDE